MLDHSKRFTLFDFPDRPVHSDTNLASPRSILARQQLRAKTKSLTFPPLSIARYLFIQLSEQGRQWRERKYPIFETVANGDSNRGSLDCESGILPLSYRSVCPVFVYCCYFVPSFSVASFFYLPFPLPLSFLVLSPDNPTLEQCVLLRIACNM